jgi:hypothetical protein
MQIEDSGERPAAEDGLGKGARIERESRKHFHHVIAPLRNNLTPKTRQDRELLEEREKAVTWFIPEEHSLGLICPGGYAQTADRIHRQIKALPFQLQGRAGYPFEAVPQIPS